VLPPALPAPIQSRDEAAYAIGEEENASDRAREREEHRGGSFDPIRYGNQPTVRAVGPANEIGKDAEKRIRRKKREHEEAGAGVSKS
jgi:hypothetical protein